MGIFDKLLGKGQPSASQPQNTESDYIPGKGPGSKLDRAGAFTGGRTSEDDPNEDFEQNPSYMGEIDLEDFSLRYGNRELNEGDIYKIRAVRINMGSSGSDIDFVSYSGSKHHFKLIWPAPELPYEQKIAFYCEVVYGGAATFLGTEGAACQSCKGKITEGQEFCPHCGHKQVKDFCPNCGTPLSSSDKACPSCSASLYTEIAFADLEKMSSEEREETRKFMTIARYGGKKADTIIFVEPEKCESSMAFDCSNINVPEMIPGQKAVFCYTTTNDGTSNLDDIKALPPSGPLPLPPANYEEIRLDDADQNLISGQYKGTIRKFWSKAKVFKGLRPPSSDEVWLYDLQAIKASDKRVFFEPKGNPAPDKKVFVALDTSTITVMYTAADSSCKLILDSILWYDTWLMPPPKAEAPPPPPARPEDYEEIDIADFISQKSSLPEGKKLKSAVLFYEPIKGENILLKIPGDAFLNFSTRNFDASQMPKNLEKGQKAIAFYTTNGRDSPILDILQAAPPSAMQVPEGYEEIDFGDFVFDFKKGKIEPGRKFMSRAQKTGSSTTFSPVGENNLCDFDPVKRMPKLEFNQIVTILYTTTADKYKPNLDDVLV